MKLAKLSLAAIVVAGLASSSFAADSLEGAFKEGKVSGQVQAYYFDRDKATSEGSIFSTGLDLSYETGLFYGFGMKATFQSSASPFADADGKTMYNSSMWGSGAQLSEIYLSYTMGKTTALVGRMYLDTPLIASSGSRLNKQAFEGAAVINTDLPNTTLIAGYVQKYQARTDGNGNFGKFTKTFGTGSGYPFNLNVEGDVDLEDGAYTLAAINKSIAGLTLTAAYANAIDAIAIYYAEASYEGKAANFTYGLAAQYYYNDLDHAALGKGDIDLYGIKATVGVGAFTFTAAYTESGKADGNLDGVVSGLGGGADLAYTMSPLNSDSYGADTKAYKIGAAYAVTTNANLGVSYTVNKMDSAAATADEKTFLAFEGDYAFEGALKGLSLSAIYEDQGKDANGQNEMWLKAIYKF